MTITEVIQSLRYRCDESSADTLFSQDEKLDAINTALIELWSMLDSSLFVDNIAYDDYTPEPQYKILNGQWYLDDVFRVERRDTATSDYIKCAVISSSEYNQVIDNSYSKPSIEHPIAVHWTADGISISDENYPVTFGGLRVFPDSWDAVRVHFRTRPRKMLTSDVTADTEVIIGNRNSSGGFDTIEPLHHILINLAEAILWKNDNKMGRSDVAKNKAMEAITVLNNKVALTSGKPING